VGDKDAGLFDKYGLDVALIYISGSSKIVQAMLAREIPVAEIAIPAVIQANQAGADLVMLCGPNHTGTKIDGQDGPEKTRGLEGQKARRDALRTSDDFLLRYLFGPVENLARARRALLARWALARNLAGLASGSIDGGVLSRRSISAPRRRASSLMADLSAIGVDYQGAGIVTRTYARERRTCSRLREGHTSGARALQERQGVQIKVLAKYSRIDAGATALEGTYRHYAVNVMPRSPTRRRAGSRWCSTSAARDPRRAS
jgi:NitT/TauT family transport system substrate-binding protein